MARITPSVLIADIKGKVGGSVFQRFKSGIILRSKSTAVNRRTLGQFSSRNTAFIVQNEWIALSDDQRAQWASFIKYYPIFQRKNKSVFISGQQAFLKFNIYRLRYGLSILSVPQFTKCDLTPVDLTLSRVGANLRLMSSRPVVAANEYIILFLTVRMLPTINNPGSRLKLIIFETTNGSTWIINDYYINVFGAIPEAGNTVFMKYTNASKLSGVPFPFKQVKVLL